MLTKKTQADRDFSDSRYKKKTVTVSTSIFNGQTFKITLKLVNDIVLQQPYYLNCFCY